MISLTFPAQPTNGTPTQTGRNWIESYWKAYVAIVVVAIVAIAIVGLIFTQPLSRIRIILRNQEEYTATVQLYLDDKMVMSGFVLPNESKTAGVYNVKTGSHFLAIEFYWSGNYPSGGTWGGSFDGIPEWTHTVNVGPLFTKDVRINLVVS